MATPLDAIVRLAVQVMHRHRQCGFDELVQLLIQRGVRPALAPRLVMFVPMAFARHVLAGTGATLPLTYTIDEDGSRRDLPLGGEQVYEAALLAAQETSDQVVVWAVAEQSAEIDVVKKLGGVGPQLANVSFTTTLMYAESLRPPQAARAIELEDESASLLHAIGQALAAHGGQVTYELEAVRAGDALLRAAVIERSRQAGRVQVRIDFAIASPQLGARELCDSCAGVGESVEDALGNGFDKLLKGSLHAIFAVLIAGTDCEDQIAWQRWTSPHGSWRACLGPLIQQHDPPDGVPYYDLLERVQQLWLSAARTPEVHWLRIYGMMGSDGLIGSEAVLDNAAWTEAAELVSAWPWPATQSAYSLRHFLILVPE